MIRHLNRTEPGGQPWSTQAQVFRALLPSAPPGGWQVTACPPASHQLCALQAGGPCLGAGALRGPPPRMTAWRRAYPVGLGSTYLSSLLGFAEIPAATLRPHSETCLLIPRREPAGPLWPLLATPHTPVPRVCPVYPHSRPFPVLSKLQSSPAA